MFIPSVSAKAYLMLGHASTTIWEVLFKEQMGGRRPSERPTAARYELKHREMEHGETPSLHAYTIKVLYEVCPQEESLLLV